MTIAYLRALRQNLRNHFDRIQLPVIRLQTSDFKEGPYRITKPGKYLLTENIVFSPRPENDFLPSTDQLKRREMVLGFFGAIIVHAQNVIIDLQGHSITRSVPFGLVQPFYSHIELSNVPFIPSQGPGGPNGFTTPLESANKVWIRNGSLLGSQPHHAIHGCGSTEILIENIITNDFEVAAVSINGAENIFIKDLKIDFNVRNKTVNGFFSSAKNALLFAQRLTDLSPVELAQVQKLHIRFEKARQEILTTGQTTDKLFRNDSQIIDGTAYGLLFHPLGQAVKDFIPGDFKGKYAKNILLENIQIQDLFLKTHEIPSMIDISNNKFLKGPSGDILPVYSPELEEDSPIVVNTGSNTVGRTSNTVRRPSNNTRSPDLEYVGNDIWDVIMILSRYQTNNDLKAGALYLPKDFQEWVKSPSNYKLVCNTDSQGHVNKGLVGIRIDGTHNVGIVNCRIDNMRSLGNLGEEKLCGSYLINHPDQTRQGYFGNDVRAISLVCSKNIDIAQCQISNLQSLNGSVWGLSVFNNCSTVKVTNLNINNLASGQKFQDGKWYGTSREGEIVEYTASYPNKVPSSFGIESETAIDFSLTKVENLSGVQVCPFSLSSLNV